MVRDLLDLPANQAAWDLPALKDDPNVAIFGKQLENAKSPPPFPKWEEIGTALNNELDKVIRTKDTGQQAAEQLEKTVDSIGTA